MKEGDVILTPLPQADGRSKNRPAVFLREMPPYRDLLVCGVSTQLQHQVKDFDEIIRASDGDFGASSVQSESLIRLGFLALLPRSRVVGTIGKISPGRHRRLLTRLAGYLLESAPQEKR